MQLVLRYRDAELEPEGCFFRACICNASIFLSPPTMKGAGKGVLDMRCYNAGVSPSWGRILNSCFNQEALFAGAGPPHALLFLVMHELCQ